ncbi:MAG TPA: hypothetical protein PKJ97_00310, partial [Candidatus Bilamarchaeaceae archaeon]|nr:hypothetical protein [Candidatus Bilamarchaeaceae archaeon]
MADAGRKCSAVLIILLSLTPLLFSQATSPCLSCGQTDLYSKFDYPSSTFDIALVATITDFSKTRSRAELERQFANYLLEKYEVDITPSINSTVSVLPVPDAFIRVLYEKSEMAGGNLTSRLVNATCLNSPGSPPRTDTNGEAQCRIDPEIYRGKCVQFYFEFYGSKPAGMPQLNPTYASANICDSNRAAFSAMGAALSSIGTSAIGNPVCIIGFIIFGLF